MKRYTVTAVRERLAEALDQADRGIPVIIERKGVRYRLSVERAKSRPRRQASRIEVLDSAVAGGEWRWEWAPDGLAFADRRPR